MTPDTPPPAVPSERLEAIQQREQKATKGPWLAKPILPRSHGGEVRCDGIEAVRQHNHPDDVDCFDADDCPVYVEREIVTTDSGYYGPKWPDADFIAHAREDIPWLVQQVQDLRAANDHSHCHDLVCNGDRTKPRGAKGVSCSCAGRDAAYAELSSKDSEINELRGQLEQAEAALAAEREAHQTLQNWVKALKEPV